MHRLRVVLLVLVALGLVVASIAAPALGASPSIHLSPSQGPPITKVSVTGSGFGSSESVTIKFGSTTVGTTTTTAGGLFAKSVNVPTTATPGAHVVKATGQTSGLSATAVFIVTTAWAQFHFSGTKMGYNPFENVITTSNVSSLTQQWSASIGSPNNGELLSSPAVVNGTLYVGGGDGFLHAFSLSTHALKWEGSTGVAYYSSPAVYQHTIYVGGSSLYSFPATCSNPCSPLWTGQT
ncbi:MAG TPA: PQQ-binding-like beta-propeller repeat protein, partial [Actinomycetota bacterium]